jgi:hypothetical protein
VIERNLPLLWQLWILYAKQIWKIINWIIFYVYYCLLGCDTIIWKMTDIPEDGNLHSYHHENPRSHSVWPRNIFEVVLSSENYVDCYTVITKLLQSYHILVLLPVARQQPRNKQVQLVANGPWTATEGRCFLCGPHWDVISRIVSSVSQRNKE